MLRSLTRAAIDENDRGAAETVNGVAVPDHSHLAGGAAESIQIVVADLRNGVVVLSLRSKALSVTVFLFLVRTTSAVRNVVPPY